MRVCPSLSLSFAFPPSPLARILIHIQMWDSCLLFLASKYALFSLRPALVLPDKRVCVPLCVRGESEQVLNPVPCLSAAAKARVDRED